MTWKEVFKLAHSRPLGLEVLFVSQGVIFLGGSRNLMLNSRSHMWKFAGVLKYFDYQRMGIDSTNFKYRLPIILNRESGDVEVLGQPEDNGFWNGSTTWAPKRSPGEEPGRGVMGWQSLRSRVSTILQRKCSSSVSRMPGMRGRVKRTAKSRGTERNGTRIPRKECSQTWSGIFGFGKEDQAWIQSVHHKMGHPDPARFARFLQNTHASPKLFLVPWTFQCDACLESQRGFQSTRPSSIHENIGFNEVVGMDVAYWTGKNGVKYPFVHFFG